MEDHRPLLVFHHLVIHNQFILIHIQTYIRPILEVLLYTTIIMGAAPEVQVLDQT
jgi:hypothetical protein